MLGQMQDWDLTLDKIIDHASNWHGHREVVSRSPEGPIVRSTYAEVHDRAKRFSNVLTGLGVKLGDRVGTLAWNTGRHLEVWYGIMGIGAVCHTLNPRLFAEQLEYIVNHADDQVIVVDVDLLPLIRRSRAALTSVKHVIVMTDAAHMPTDMPEALCYETLLAQSDADCVWGGFDERTAAGLCYTSGTTGDPKGVLYSHRSNFLHSYMCQNPDILGIGQSDVVLPIVPMFHANAWTLAFSAPAVGAKLVMPGPRLDGASVHELLETEGVTFSAAVPTVWQMLLTHLQATGAKLTTLKRVVIGGAALPESILRAFQDDYGVDVVHGWGMTELSPVGTVSAMTARTSLLPDEDRMRVKLTQGRPPLGMEMKVVDQNGVAQPHDGKSPGVLVVKGPNVVDRYFRYEKSALDADGYFDTGDIATLDADGFMKITDRTKDVIKSGGEWISSIDIENHALSHPHVAMAAVIGVPHPKWDERPLLVAVLKAGVQATKAELLAHLEGKIARWWMPDDVVFVEEVALGATGKIDKRALRLKLEDYRLPVAT